MKRFCFNKSVFRYIFFLFIFWFAAINILDWTSKYIPFAKREGYNYVELSQRNPSFFWNRANFDGIHYLDIARRGYGIYQQAFFPLYPKLIELLTPVLGNKDLLAGMLISNVSFLISMYFFYKLVLIDFDKKAAENSLLFLIVFPTSFFFSLVYSEGFFFLLIISCFYAVRKNKWLIAGILGLLASNARFVGIFLFPALIYEWWQQRNIKYQISNIKNLIFILIIPLGLLSYMYFLKVNFQDPLMFIHTQPFFGAERTGGKIILLYQVIFRYIKMILTTKLDILYFAVWTEFLSAIGFIVLIILSFSKKIRLSYLIFSIPAFIIPTLSGTFSSLPRYVLVLFPCFIYLGLIKNKALKNIILFLFFIFFVISTVLFFKGYWIA